MNRPVEATSLSGRPKELTYSVIPNSARVLLQTQSPNKFPTYRIQTVKANECSIRQVVPQSIIRLPSVNKSPIISLSSFNSTGLRPSNSISYTVRQPNSASILVSPTGIKHTANVIHLPPRSALRHVTRPPDLFNVFYTRPKLNVNEIRKPKPRKSTESHQSEIAFNSSSLSLSQLLEKSKSECSQLFTCNRKQKSNVLAYWVRHLKKRCEPKLSPLNLISENSQSICSDVCNFLVDEPDSDQTLSSAGNLALEKYPIHSLQLHKSMNNWRTKLREIITDAKDRFIWLESNCALLSCLSADGQLPSSNRKRKIALNISTKPIVEDSFSDESTDSEYCENLPRENLNIIQTDCSKPKRQKVLGLKKKTKSKIIKSPLVSPKKHLNPIDGIFDSSFKKPKLTISVLRTTISKLKNSLKISYTTRRQQKRKNVERAKFLARECLKLHRKVAKDSHRLHKTSIVRGRRIAREIAKQHYDDLNLSQSSALRFVSATSLDVDGRPLTESLPNSEQVITSGIQNLFTLSQEERLSKKRAEKAQAERRKAELELWEAQRQQRKLNFLIKRTEIYAHFMSKKNNTSVDEKRSICENLMSDDNLNVPLPDICKNRTELYEKEFEILKESTINSALIAVDKQTNQLNKFSTANDNESNTYSQPQLEFDFRERSQPKLFQGQLKQYQLKGMNWLLNLYEQGINGILADEMGLGKTIQTIALFGALTEEPYFLWGPYLIIAPNSTVHNWVQELNRFIPELKVTPYWGSIQDRKKLRCRWSFLANKSLLSPDSHDNIMGNSKCGLHVVVTNYPVLMEDYRMLTRIPWQYMVLDEAQAIKNSSSQRWNILRSFQCRNRLLLSGTPIQNNMKELWSLLHFIMPALFDSHEEFNAWFSKDIANQTAEGSTSTCNLAPSQVRLNDQQLRRLHLILKPFMLRRIKSDVEHELLPKLETQIICNLSKRQIEMYANYRQRIRQTVSVEDLNFSSTQNQLCNIVMELRKICNHPNLVRRLDAIKFAPNNCLLLREASYAFLIPRLILLDMERRFFFHFFKSVPTFLCEFSSPTNYLKDIFSHNKISFYLNVGWWSICRNNLNVDSELGLHWVFVGEAFSNLTHCWTYYKCWPEIIIYEPITFHDFSRHNWKLIIPGSKWQPEPIPSINHLQSVAFTNFFLRTNAFPLLMLPINFYTHVHDSGKLVILDQLLNSFEAQNKVLGSNHKDLNKVLIYSQMTRMLDILEEYMHYRMYRYVRLDGSKSLSDRNEAVNAFQKDPSLFVFLLSTRAGGLGINLTAANVVIFYDSDWNPTMDRQAMDRAHRFGQTRQVLVYRLICANSIELRMMQCAQQKEEMQRRVIVSGVEEDFKIKLNEDVNEEKQPEPVSSNFTSKDALNLLLLDDEEMAERLRQKKRQPGRGRPPALHKVSQENNTESTQSFAGFYWAIHKNRGGGRPRKMISATQSVLQASKNPANSIDEVISEASVDFVLSKKNRGRPKRRESDSVE